MVKVLGHSNQKVKAEMLVGFQVKIKADFEKSQGLFLLLFISTFEKLGSDIAVVEINASFPYWNVTTSFRIKP